VLTLSRKAGYALIALSHLGRQPQRFCSAREIADCYQIPLALLMNLLKTLTQHGLVKSVRGAKGGYQLARPPEQITLADIVEVLEGPLRFADCVEQADRQGCGGGPCKVQNNCPVKSAIFRLNERIRSVLADVTVADVVADTARFGEAKSDAAGQHGLLSGGLVGCLKGKSNRDNTLEELKP